MAKRVNVSKISEILEQYKNKKVTEELIGEILQQLQTTGHQKTIEKDGKLYVWCNFHQQYEPAENFNIKIDKKGNEKFKSNCKEGEKLLRKFRALRRKIEAINLKLYRLGKMTSDLENDIMSKLTFDLANEYEFDPIPIIDIIYPNNIKQDAIKQIEIK